MIVVIRKYTIVLALILSAICAEAQSTLERFALNSIEKGKWEKAKRQILKSLRKDSLNATGRYVFAKYFFSGNSPDFDIDSAYSQVMLATKDFESSSSRDREKMARFPLDTAILISLRKRIDSAAFERAKYINSEQGYIYFITHFPLAMQRERALDLRDEAAFMDALKANTYQAYHDFLEKYPRAQRAHDARERYERLLFETQTADKRLRSYESFLQEHPQTPYREIIEEAIFQISTAAGNSEDFLHFIRAYPDASCAKRARNIVYHLLKEQQVPYPINILTDSLRRLETLEKGYWIPFLKGDRFGFMNKSGKVILPPEARELDKTYLCGNIIEDVLVFSNKVINRNGTVIFNSDVDQLDDLGYGFLLIESADCTKIIHKSGYSPVSDCLDEARLLAGKFIAASSNNQSSLWTLAGTKLAIGNWDEIQELNGILAFKKNGKWKLATPSAVAKVADRLPLSLFGEYDEIKTFTDNLIWVKNGSKESILDQNLDEKIPLSNHTISQSYFGIVCQSPLGVRFYSRDYVESGLFEQIKILEPWTAVKKAGVWRLIDPLGKGYKSQDYDSLYFTGPFAVGVLGDTSVVHFDFEISLKLKQAKLDFIPGKRSEFFLLVEEEKKRSIYANNGRKLFTIEYDQIQYLTQGIFSVTKKDKKGIINAEGKVVWPVEFDAIGNFLNGKVGVLKNMKFGFVDIENRKQIKPEYDKNLVLFNDQSVVAYKNGAYGFVGWDNKPQSKFEFEEIKFWNDTSALVRKNSMWNVYDIKSGVVLLEGIKNFKTVSDTPDEKILIIQQGSNFGVISNRSGIIIPATFSDILNVGSAEEPTYFTEKHVEEASLFVVIYYDGKGKLLYREAYEIEDYEKIYCNHNR